MELGVVVRGVVFKGSFLGDRRVWPGVGFVEMGVFVYLNKRLGQLVLGSCLGRGYSLVGRWRGGTTGYFIDVFVSTVEYCRLSVGGRRI